MNQSIFMDKYPIRTIEILKTETNHDNLNEICDYFINKVKHHPKGAYIGLFDHYAHTEQLEDGVIIPEIKGAKLVVFCFGPKLLDPRALAVRPRSIGVADMGDRFFLTFMEPPVDALTSVMESWIYGLKNKESSLS
ncbi:hypothetical protein KKB55_05515 [Myxococcota bacterium]|nr:hypothetical protein [Myxococcota bacterium]MBU1897212.1 hypothetical protein [Myxococcota bacterium]